MRYSNTTIRELSAKYRSILKKCACLNAIIIMGTALTAGAEVINLNDAYNRGEFTNIVHDDGNSYSLTTQTISLNSSDNHVARAGKGTLLDLGDESTTSISITGAENPDLWKSGIIAINRGQINVTTDVLTVAG